MPGACGLLSKTMLPSGAQHAALFDQRRHERQPAERGIRHRGQIAGGAPDRQDRLGVVAVNVSLRPLCHVLARGDDAAAPGGRVDLRGAQRHAVGRRQLGADAAVDKARAAHAQVALDVEAHVVKADQVAQAAHIHQIRRHVQPVAVVEVLQRLGSELHEEIGALQPHIARLIEQQVGRAQVHHAGRRRVRAQRQHPDRRRLWRMASVTLPSANTLASSARLSKPPASTRSTPRRPVP